MTLRRVVCGVVAALGVVFVSSSHAYAPRWRGTFIGCQDWHAPGGHEWLTPKQEPEDCSLLFSNDFSGIVPLGISLQLWNTRWSDWGASRASGRTSVGLYDDAPSFFHRFNATVTAFDLQRDIDPVDCGSPGPNAYSRIEVS